MAAHISTVQNSRLRTMLVPREHGAWGMLLVPLVTGAIVAARATIDFVGLAWFVLAGMALFWLRTPVESWLGTSPIKAQSSAERRTVGRAILAIAALAICSVAALLWREQLRGLLIIGAVAALAFAAQMQIKKLGRGGRMPAQVIGAIGLTSTAAGAYYVATGRLDRTAIALWLANWIFAGDQIHFVQVRIHSARAVSFRDKLRHGLPFLVAQAGLVIAIVAGWRTELFPAAVTIAFLPVFVRGSLWFLRGAQPLDVRRLGFSELGQALLFGALLCAAFLI
jgi:YwiC-like protein